MAKTKTKQLLPVCGASEVKCAGLSTSPWGPDLFQARLTFRPKERQISKDSGLASSSHCRRNVKDHIPYHPIIPASCFTCGWARHPAAVGSHTPAGTGTQHNQGHYRSLRRKLAEERSFKVKISRNSTANLPCFVSLRHPVTILVLCKSASQWYLLFLLCVFFYFFPSRNMEAVVEIMSGSYDSVLGANTGVRSQYSLWRNIKLRSIKRARYQRIVRWMTWRNIFFSIRLNANGPLSWQQLHTVLKCHDEFRWLFMTLAIYDDYLFMSLSVYYTVLILYHRWLQCDMHSFDIISRP